MDQGREIDLLKPLGAGGFGVVYLARMRGRDGFSRRVAVKLMRQDHLQNAEVLGRQRDEARLLGLLQHPNIVQVFDLTELRGSPAVVMEYVEGADVSSLIKFGGPLPGPAALGVVAAVASALDAGWSFVPPDTGRPLHVVHRDIKPANVLITVHGVVKVLDFGVARADFDREGHTQSVAFGTPRFMAPEQFLRGELTGANDVYALGVTAWEMLTGQSFERPSLEESFHRKAVAVQVDELPEIYREGVGRMLRHDPEQRPSAAEVVSWTEELAVPGETLRAYARRMVPQVMELRDMSLAQSGSGLAPPSPASGSGQGASGSGVRSPTTGHAPSNGPPSSAASGLGTGLPGPARPPAHPPTDGVGALDTRPDVAADSGVSIAQPTPAPRESAAAWLAGGVAAAAGVVGVSVIAVGLGWALGIVPRLPGTGDGAPAATDPGAALTADQADAGHPSDPAGASPAAPASTPEGASSEPAHDASGGTASAAPTAARTTTGASTGKSVSSARSTAPEPEAPVRIAPSGAAAPSAPADPPAELPAPTAAAVTAAPTVTTPAPSAAPASTAVVTVAPAERKTRTLTIVADAIGLPVRVDGTKLGVTPLKNVTLSYGFHDIQVDAAAYSADINANTLGTLRYNSAQRKWEWLQ